MTLLIENEEALGNMAKPFLLLGLLWMLMLLLVDLTKGEIRNVSGTCAAEAQFTVFDVSLKFDEAVGFCVEQGSTLARIGNANEHFRVVDLIITSDIGNNVWIGK